MQTAGLAKHPGAQKSFLPLFADLQQAAMETGKSLFLLSLGNMKIDNACAIRVRPTEGTALTVPRICIELQQTSQDWHRGEAANPVCGFSLRDVSLFRLSALKSQCLATSNRRESSVEFHGVLRRRRTREFSVFVTCCSSVGFVFLCLENAFRGCQD